MLSVSVGYRRKLNFSTAELWLAKMKLNAFQVYLWVHFPCADPVLRLNLTRGWYLLCVTVQEKTRVLHDDQAPGFLHTLQEAAKRGSVLPNEVTQLAEPACDFLQQLHSGHSAQIVCTKMTTTWKPRAFLWWPPFWKHSLCWNTHLWNPVTTTNVTETYTNCWVPGSVDLVLLSLSGCFFKGFPRDFLVSQPNCRPSEANTCGILKTLPSLA